MVQPPSMCSAILAFGRSFYISWAGKRFPLPRNRKFWRGRPVLCYGRSPRVLGERQVALKVQRNEASSETVFDARSSAQAAVRGGKRFPKAVSPASFTSRAWPCQAFSSDSAAAFFSWPALANRDSFLHQGTTKEVCERTVTWPANGRVRP